MKQTKRVFRGKGSADMLAEAAGVDLRDVAKRWPMGRRRITEEEIINRVSYIRRAARIGGLNAAAAAELAHHLSCDPAIFLWGHAAYTGANVNTRRAGGRGGGLGNRRQSTARRWPTPEPEKPKLQLV